MEYEYLFTKSLHELLKEKIKGRVFCKVINDILIVDIDTKEGISYGCTIDNFARKLQLDEISQGGLVEEIVKEYRKKVLSTFFF